MRNRIRTNDNKQQLIECGGSCGEGDVKGDGEVDVEGDSEVDVDGVGEDDVESDGGEGIQVRCALHPGRYSSRLLQKNPTPPPLQTEPLVTETTVSKVIKTATDRYRSQ